MGKTLVWHSWQPGESLQSGKYGIKEPLATSTVIDATTADLILVPTVACDLPRISSRLRGVVFTIVY